MMILIKYEKFDPNNVIRFGHMKRLFCVPNNKYMCLNVRSELKYGNNITE